MRRICTSVCVVLTSEMCVCVCVCVCVCMCVCVLTSGLPVDCNQPSQDLPRQWSLLLLESDEHPDAGVVGRQLSPTLSVGHNMNNISSCIVVEGKSTFIRIVVSGGVGVL